MTYFFFFFLNKIGISYIYIIFKSSVKSKYFQNIRAYKKLKQAQNTKNQPNYFQSCLKQALLETQRR
jgi:hypothetical protein